MNKNMRKCPFCGEEILATAIKCPYCDEYSIQRPEDEDTEPRKKICPYCKEEILATAIKCQHCGEFLNEDREMPSKPQNNYPKVVFTVFIILIIVNFIIGFIADKKQDLDVSSEPMQEQEQSYGKQQDYCGTHISVQQAINDLFSKEQELNAFFSKIHSQAEKDKKILEYINTLKNCADVINSCNAYFYQQDMSEKTLTTFNPELQKGNSYVFNGLTVFPTIENVGYDNRVTKLKITSPNVNGIRLVYVGEGVFEATLDYDALSLFLSSKLGTEISNDWQQYLKIKRLIQNTLGDSGFLIDGYASANLSELNDFISHWEAFIVTYPDFTLKNEIQNDIYEYTYEFLCSHYVYTDAYSKISKDAVKLYEEYLKAENHVPKMYDAVEKAIAIAKRYNYAASDEYNNFCLELENSVPTRH